MRFAAFMAMQLLDQGVLFTVSGTTYKLPTNALCRVF